MIAPMKRIIIAARETDKKHVLEILRESGVIHIEPSLENPLPLPSDVLTDISNAEKALAILSGNKRFHDRDDYLRFLEAERARSVLSGIKPSDPAKYLDMHAANFIKATLETHQNLDEICRKKLEISREAEVVKPWGQIDSDSIDFLKNSGLNVRFFILTKGRESEIEAETLQIISEEAGMIYLVALSRKEITFPADVPPVAIPEKDFSRLSAELAGMENQEKSLKATLQELSVYLKKVSDYINELNDRKRYVEVELNRLQNESIFCLQGWIPEKSVSSFQESLGKSKVPVCAETREPLDEESPPTKLENSWWCKPVEGLYGVLGIVPGYREADVSPFFLPFLAIFTAMLVADGGYSLTALIALVVLYYPLSQKGVPKPLIELFIILFAGGAIYGVLTNSYFGYQFEFAKKLMFLDPGTNDGQEFLKRLCFFLGALHLTIAHIWKIARQSISLATIGEVGWIVFLWAMFDLVNLLVLGNSDTQAPARMMPMFQVSLVMILLFTAPSTNIFSMVGQGLGAIALNAAGFLSDIISYIRLWAVGLAGGILAANFNEMASGFPVPISIIIFICAHLMNFSLALVAVFAHGVRLNLLEFSNHLGMEWSGKPFDPFAKADSAEKK
ncbi:MAG: hypothetical protein HQM10_13300 [Candidatus Riflebacteria bacterium]|nr:hypothetical protein [Candidatus Riflebacteria bacterium]